MTDAPTTSSRRRLFYALAVVACCVLTFVAKSVVNEPRRWPGHGDISFYVTVARNLAEGRGFVIDYIWNFWAEPAGIPQPSNVWWMPLPSIIAAIGMVLGDGSYVAGQTATIALSSFLPLVVYLLGRDLFGCPRVGLAGALLSTTFHLFLDQPSAPLSHCPYLVFASLTLWLALRATQSPRLWPLVGASIALTQLSRSDGILLFATAGVCALIGGQRPWLDRPSTRRTIKALAGAGGLAVVGYAVVMSPWWARNLADFGVLQPGDSLRSLFMSHYLQWYSLPEHVTPDTLLAEGWGPVIDHRISVGANNWASMHSGMVTGAALRNVAPNEPWLLATLWLSWIGLLSCFKRRFGFLFFHAAMIWAFYSLAFTAVGNESFRSGMYSLYPFLVICSVRGVQNIAHLVTRPIPEGLRERVAVGLWSVGVIALTWGQFDYGRESMKVKSGHIERLHTWYEHLAESVLEPRGLMDTTLMACNVHRFHAMTGARVVQIPYEDEPTIRAVAERYGVTHLVLIGDDVGGDLAARPALKYIDRMPGYRWVFGPLKVGQFPVRIYEFDHEDPTRKHPRPKLPR